MKAVRSVRITVKGDSAAMNTDILGYAGEHCATMLSIYLEEDWPRHAQYYLHLKPAEGEGHIAGPLSKDLALLLPQNIMREGSLSIQVCAVQNVQQPGECIVKSACVTGRVLPSVSNPDTPLEEQYDGLLYGVLQEVTAITEEVANKLQNGEFVGPRGEPGPPGEKGEKGDPGEDGTTVIKGAGVVIPPDSTGAVNITAKTIGAISDQSGTWVPQLVSADGKFTCTVSVMTSWWSRLGKLMVCCFKARITNSATAGAADSPISLKGFPAAVEKDGYVTLPYCVGLALPLQGPVICQTVGGALCQAAGERFQNLTAEDFIQSAAKVYLGGYAVYQAQV